MNPESINQPPQVPFIQNTQSTPPPPSQPTQRESHIPKVAVITAIVSFLTIAPAPVAMSLAVAGLAGAKTEREKKLSKRALFITIAPLIIFAVILYLTFNDLLSASGYRIIDSVTPLVAASYVIMAMGGVAILIGLIALITGLVRKDASHLKQQILILLFGALLVGAGVGQYFWVQSPQAEAVWIEAKSKSTNPDDKQLVKEIRYFQTEPKTFTRNDTIRFADFIISDVVVDDNVVSALYQPTETSRLVAIGFNAEPAPEASAEDIERFEAGYHESIRLLASGTKYATSVSPYQSLGQNTLKNLDRSYVLLYTIRKTATIDSIEYTIDTPSLDLVKKGGIYPDSITWTLKR